MKHDVLTAAVTLYLPVHLQLHRQQLHQALLRFLVHWEHHRWQLPPVAVRGVQTRGTRYVQSFFPVDSVRALYLRCQYNVDRRQVWCSK